MNTLQIICLLASLCLVAGLAEDTVCPTIIGANCSCYGDRNIDCSSKNLKTIPEFAPSNVTYNSLLLHNNEISIIQANAFHNIRFRRLDARGNSITEINEMAFSGLEQVLSEVSLSLHSIDEFPHAALEKLANLRILNVTDYQRSKLPSGALSNMHVLEELRMTSGQLAELSIEVLGGQEMATLRHLDLQNNHFNRFPDDIVSAMPQLRYLCLESNLIETLAAYDVKGANLEELDLSRNPLTTIHVDAFTDVSKTLIKLDVTTTHLDDGRARALLKLSNLKELIINFNKVIDISPFLSGMRALVTLKASSNSIDRLTRYSLQTARNLAVLDLSSNPLKSVEPDAFVEMQSLQELNLANAGGLVINSDSFVRQSQSLRVLNLASVSLQEIQWAVFDGLSSLMSITVDNCSLRNIPDFRFAQMHSLTFLSMSRNGITEIKQRSFVGLENSLEKLILSGNKLTTIDHCVFNRFTKLTQLDVSDNPLMCDCQLKWLYDWTRVNPLFQFFNPWKCYDEQSVHSPTEEDFKHCNDTDAAECEDFTVSTVAPAPEPLVALFIVNTTSSTASLRWSVMAGVPTNQGFLLNCSCTSQAISIEQTARDYQLTDLSPDTHYQVCLQVVGASPNLTSAMVDVTCVNITTLSSTQKAMIISIAACAAALLLLLLLVATICILVRRSRIRRQKLELEKAKPKVLAGQTKHFTRQRPMSLDASTSLRLTGDHRMYSRSVDNQLDVRVDNDHYKVVVVVNRNKAQSLGNVYDNGDGSERYVICMDARNDHEQEQEVYDEINDDAAQYDMLEEHTYNECLTPHDSERQTEL